MAGSGATSLYYLLLEDALQDASGYFLLQRHNLGQAGGILQRTERRNGMTMWTL